MELEHSFSVPVPVERAWDVLLDVERVAPCMPGATVDSVEGDTITARIKVKVGPIQMIYAGTARFTERDEAARIVVLEAAGKETRGAGTASAQIRSQLTADGDSTNVTVHTSLNVTGKPAQFGRGVMAEVGGRLIGIFAGNLAAMLAAGQGGGAGGGAAGATGGAAATGEPSTAAASGLGSGEDAVAANTDAAAVVGVGGTGAGDEALPIDVLNLSSRAWSSLRQDGIQTLGDLTRRTEQQLRAIDGVGPASLADIRTKLADRGLALADAAPGGTTGPATANGARTTAGADDLAQVTPLRPARNDAAEAQQPAWQPDSDAIDLLDVAGLPVLKRAVPAVAGLLVLLLIVFGIRRRRRG